MPVPAKINSQIEIDLGKKRSRRLRRLPGPRPMRRDRCSASAETDRLTERGLTPSPVGSHENLFPVPQRPPMGTNVNGTCIYTLYSGVDDEMVYFYV